MTQKKLMLLGGIRYLLPVIKAAHEQGYYVITADYIPDNIAHKYSDEYVNVSIIDKEAVLKVAQEKQIDGIMSFGVDPGVVSASYVQNKMGLPSFGPFESVEILQNKDKFRAFLTKNGFNVPQAKGFDSIDAAMNEIYWYPWPVIVKPTDAAGSKGVTRVDRPEDLKAALEYAMEHSISGHIIVEEFIEKDGCSSDTDSMSVDGKLVFTSFCAQRFDADATNPYTPAAYSWPSTFTKEQETYLKSEIQRLLTLLGLKTAVYNIETRIGTNGKPYISNHEDICFNMSQSNRMVACAISNREIGIDIEKKDPLIDLKIADTFFINSEYQTVKKSENSIDEFFKYWVLKESYMKYTGLGFLLKTETFEIIDDEDGFKVRNQNPDLKEDEDKIKFSFFDLNPYKLAISSEDEVDEIFEYNVEDLY